MAVTLWLMQSLARTRVFLTVVKDTENTQTTKGIQDIKFKALQIKTQ